MDYRDQFGSECEFCVQNSNCSCSVCKILRRIDDELPKNLKNSNSTPKSSSKEGSSNSNSIPKSSNLKTSNSIPKSSFKIHDQKREGS